MVSPDAVTVWPNMIWPTSAVMFAMRVDGLRDAAGAGGELAIAFGAVAVELDVREMDRQAFGGVHGRERRVDVARHAKVAAMHVQRMRHAELVHRPRQRP